MTAAQLVQLVQWKLTRGTWRPRLLDFAKAHSDETVLSTSGRAFQLIEGYEPSSGDSQLKVLLRSAAT